MVGDKLHCFICGEDTDLVIMEDSDAEGIPVCDGHIEEARFQLIYAYESEILVGKLIKMVVGKRN